MNFYIIIYNGNLKGESGESCNSKYELKSACKECGTGAQLIDNLIAKEISNVKKDFFQTYDRDFLISEKLYLFLLKKEIKLDLMHRVVIKNGKETNYYHLTSNFFFPKASSKTTGLRIENQCLTCHRNGYYNDVIYNETSEGVKKTFPPIQLVYEDIKNYFLESSEIFNTWESIGSSNLKAEGIKVIRYARPMLIVSERIKKVFEEFGVKNAIFEKIIVNPKDTQFG